MAKPFKGVINVDVTQSIPDWEPYKQPIAPDGTPNVLFIVLDDVGFSAMEPFGGMIETPNIKRIAGHGITYTNFHTTALCSPTRSCLMTGRNHTTNGMGTITEAASGFPAPMGMSPSSAGPSPRFSGSEAGTPTPWEVAPHARGRDEHGVHQVAVAPGPRVRALLRLPGRETNQWYPDLVYDNHPVEQPRSPEEGYHLTTDLTDKALEFVRDAKAIAPDKPFFFYFCPGACHAPHHVPKEWADRYKGRFDMGYEAYRELVFARQKQMGIMPRAAELSPINPYAGEKNPDGTKSWSELDMVRPWDSLSSDEKRLFTRMAEVYAGFLSHADHEIGRLLDYLETSGQLDNTMIVLVSDNGASGEGGPNGSVNENKLFNGHPRHDRGQSSLPRRSRRTAAPTTTTRRGGRSRSTPRSSCGSAMPTGKGYRRPDDRFLASRCDGQRRVPAVYPRGGHRSHHLRGARHRPPRDGEGLHTAPARGGQLRGHLLRASTPATGKQTQFYSMGGTQGIWHQGWKAANVTPSAPDMWADYANLRWELFHTDSDPTESHDLAAEHPGKLKELIAMWWTLAGQYQALPLENRDAVQILTTERPQIAKPRNQYIYYPGGAEVPESVAPNIRNRSYTVAVEVDIETGPTRAESFRARIAVRGPCPLPEERQAQVRV